MAVVFSAVGFYQYDTRNIFENPKLGVSNAYAPFFRVNSVFWDPSVYGALPRARDGAFDPARRAGAIPALVVARGGRARRHLARPADLVLAVELRGPSRRGRRGGVRRVAVAGAHSRRARVGRARGHHRRSAADPALAPAPHDEWTEQRLERTSEPRRQRDPDREARIRCAVSASAASNARTLSGCSEAQGQGAEDRGVAQHARDGRGGDGGGRARALCVAPRGGVQAGVSPGRPRSGARRGARPRGDLLPLALLQRVLRGSDDVGSVGLVALASPLLVPVRRVPQPPVPSEGGGAGLIEHWRRALVLAPHTDDGEFGCGGTMARLVESGCEVRYVAFSIATRSLPEGFPPDTLAREVREATDRARHSGGAADGARLRRAHVPGASAGHPRGARRALGGVAAGGRLPAVAPRRAPGSQDDRRGGPARVQAHDDPRLRDPVEQLRLRVPVVRRAREEAHRAEGRRRSRSTRHSSIAATRIPSTCGTSRARTGST